MKVIPNIRLKTFAYLLLAAVLGICTVFLAENWKSLLTLFYMYREEAAKNQKQPVEATKWKWLQAQLGNASSLESLGILYERGGVVPQDFIEACKWYQLAAAQDKMMGISLLESIKQRMTPDQIAEAKRRAAQFTPYTAFPKDFVPAKLGIGRAQFGKDDQARFLELLKGVLPSDCQITKTTGNAKPPDWDCFESNGFRVEGTRGTNTFSICFVPRDWIGISRLRAWKLGIYVHVLVNEDYKVVMRTTEKPRNPYFEASRPLTVEDCLGKLGLWTTSLVNSGWSSAKEIFKGRFEQADQAAARLIAQYCADNESRGMAAGYLVLAGVPAKSVFLKAVTDWNAGSTTFCISALGFFPSRDSFSALSKVLQDPNANMRTKLDAAFSLKEIAERDEGPELLNLLAQRTTNDFLEVTRSVIEALGIVRYKPAGPELLKCMESTNDPRFKALCAEALAGVGYSNAIPIIRTFMTEEWKYDLTNHPDHRLGKVVHYSDSQERAFRQTAKLALFRLTGPWGEPTEEVRLMIEPPANAVVGQQMPMTLWVENMSTKTLMITDYLIGTLTINGTRKQDFPLFGWWDGIVSFFPGTLWPFQYDLSREIAKPGKYSIQFEARGAKSNVATFEVKKP